LAKHHENKQLFQFLEVSYGIIQILSRFKQTRLIVGSAQQICFTPWHWLALIVLYVLGGLKLFLSKKLNPSQIKSSIQTKRADAMKSKNQMNGSKTVVNVVSSSKNLLYVGTELVYTLGTGILASAVFA
jgi:hypothetical protein